MNEMKEAVGNWREAKQFSPADENDFLRWLDKADTEEKLFSRLTFWFTFRGQPADQNQRYHLVQERARELRLWNGLELKLRRWQDRVADEYEQIGKEAFAARIGEGIEVELSERVRVLLAPLAERLAGNGDGRPGGRPAAGCPGAGDRKACRGAGVVGAGAV